LLEKIAQQILETEVIEGEELQSLLNQVRPVEKVPAAV
jgi:cell division protease FtsH